MSFIHMVVYRTEIRTPTHTLPERIQKSAGGAGRRWSVYSWTALGKDRQKHSRLGASLFKRRFCISDQCFFLKLKESLFDKEGFWGEGVTMEVIGRVESACSTVLTLRKKVKSRGCDGIIVVELTFEAQML